MLASSRWSLLLVLLVSCTRWATAQFFQFQQGGINLEDLMGGGGFGGFGGGGGGGGGAAGAAAAAGSGMYGRPPLGNMPSQAGYAAALSNASHSHSQAALSNASALSNAVATRAAAALQRAATSSGSAVGAPAANLLDQLGSLRAGSYLDGITAWASESIEDVRLAHPQGGAQ